MHKEMIKLRSPSVFVTLLLLVSLTTAVSVFAHSEKNFTDTKKLIDSGVPCSNLTDDKLESIGEYYMEQMHPGEAHEFMHQRMGLVEGSEAEEKYHINLAKTMYCGELGSGMMDMGAGGMMHPSNAGMNDGMMGSYFGAGNFVGFLWLVILSLSIVALILLIVWLYRQIRRK